MEEMIPDEEEDEDGAAREERLTVESEGKEEEAAYILEEALGMEVEEDVEGDVWIPCLNNGQTTLRYWIIVRALVELRVQNAYNFKILNY